MDGEKFDGIIRALTHETDRRRLLGRLAGSALGSALAAAGWAGAEAKRQHKKRGKSAGARAAGGNGCPKVRICHRTSSAKNPYNVIEVCESAVPAHAQDGDLVSCPNLAVVDFDTCTCVCPVDNITCPTGETLDKEQCKCVEVICTENTYGPPDCVCFSTLDGGDVACFDISGSCLNTCDADTPCGPGLVCTISPCCGHPAGVGVCNPPCASETCTCGGGAAACAIEAFFKCGPEASGAARPLRPSNSDQSVPRS